MIIKTGRTQEELSPVLQNPEAQGNDLAYWVFSEVSTNGDKWVNMTIVDSGGYGGEFTKTFGHYHSVNVNETYHFVEGNGIFMLQKKHFENGKWTPNKVDEVILLTMKPGEEVIVTPEWGHSWSNIGSLPLITFDNWASGHRPEDYEHIEKLRGMAYYLINKNGKAEIEANPNYENLPTPKFMTPAEFAKLTA